MNKVSLNDAVSILEAEDHNRGMDLLARFVVDLDRQEVELEDKLIALDKHRDSAISLAMSDNLTAKQAYDLVRKIDYQFAQMHNTPNETIIRGDVIAINGSTTITNWVNNT